MDDQDKKKKKKDESHVHEELKGFELKVNPFGQIESNYDMDKINEFLNERVDDKKLREHDESDEEE